MKIFYRLFNFFYFLFLKKDYKNIVIYSEGINYKYYFLNLIKILIEENNEKITYVSSEKDDFINNKNVKNIYIGKGFFRTIFFATLNCKYLILTLTDLGNSYIKKSKFCYRYIYLYHSAISTHVGYKKDAFWNYDIILCNGEYQFQEIRYAEKLYKLNKKILIKTGYMYFEFLKSKKLKHNKEKTNTVVLAPTWINSKGNLFEDFAYGIIDNLLSNKYKVVLRPHPEHFKHFKKTIKKIRDKFDGNEKFHFEENINDFFNLENSDLLITDYSGISIEYILIFKKPVIFINSSEKIRNKDFAELNIEHIEKKVKREFGYEIEPKNIHDIKNLVKTAITEGIPKQNESVEKFIINNFYNSRDTKKLITELLINK